MSSKIPNGKTYRAKSGGSLRPLGAFKLSQGSASQHYMPNRPRKNDPALLIHQLQIARTPSPPNGALQEKEREFKILHDSYLHVQRDVKLQKKKLRKREVISSVGNPWWKKSIFQPQPIYLEKERKLRDQISALEKLIAELQFQVKTKSDVCNALQITLDKKVKDYEERITNAEAEHNATQGKLQETKNEVTKKQERIDAIILEYEEKIKEMEKMHDKQLKQLQSEKDRELSERDEKITTMKKRMAETIGKNSTERQQQLEELKRDLIKSSHEARELQKQLKLLHLKPQQCSNCVTLAANLEEKTLQLRLKEKTINSLQDIGKSMQLQLHQQDIILKKWEDREEAKNIYK